MLVCAYVYGPECVYVNACLYVHVCNCVCVPECVYMCLYVCLCMHVCICVWGVSVSVCARVRMRMRVNMTLDSTALVDKTKLSRQDWSQSQQSFFFCLLGSLDYRHVPPNLALIVSFCQQ